MEIYSSKHTLTIKFSMTEVFCVMMLIVLPYLKSTAVEHLGIGPCRSSLHYTWLSAHDSQFVAQILSY